MADDEPVESPLKTVFNYDYYILRGSEEYEENLGAFYKLMCYRTLEGSWLGIVVKRTFGYSLEEKDRGFKIFAVEYKNGTLIDRDINSLFPEFFQTAKSYYEHNQTSPCLVSDGKGLVFQSSNYWPVRFLWNGNTFELDPESVILTDNIDNTYGWFSGKCFVKLGESTDELDVNNNCVEDGEVMAHFDVEDSIVVGYTVKSPKCGFAQARDAYTISSKPVAIGFPIGNVLDYEKTPYGIKDHTIVTEHRDGNYVITQQINHNKSIRRDIFIEFIAKDEQSNIESIRVYTKEIIVTLKTELDDESMISERTKSMFWAIGLNTDDPNFGAFKSFSGFGNGFDVYFDGSVKKIRFQTYDTDEGGTLAVLAKYYDWRGIPDLQSWLYLNKTLTTTDFTIPVPEPEQFGAWNFYGDYVTPEKYNFSLTNEGIKYFADSEFSDDASNHVNPDFYEIRYRWTGKDFELTTEQQNY